jgi:hypothetical protein
MRSAINKKFKMSRVASPLAVYTYMLLEKQNENYR